MIENQLRLRPTEKHCVRFYVELSCQEELYQVTAYPPIRLKKKPEGPDIDGGFLCVSHLQSHCRDTHSLRACIARAWRAFWGCPDSDLYFDMPEDVERVLAAIRDAMPIAFPKEDHDEKPNETAIP